MKISRKIALFLLTALFTSSVSSGFAMETFKEKSFEDFGGCGCGKKKKGKWDE